MAHAPPSLESDRLRKLRYARSEAENGEGQSTRRHPSLDDDLIAQLHAVLGAHLTCVQLDDERHVLLDDGVGVGLTVLRMADARVLLLQAIPWIMHSYPCAR